MKLKPNPLLYGASEAYLVASISIYFRRLRRRLGGGKQIGFATMGEVIFVI